MGFKLKVFCFPKLEGELGPRMQFGKIFFELEFE
jgi:hypothetical protein